MTETENIWYHIWSLSEPLNTWIHKYLKPMVAVPNIGSPSIDDGAWKARLITWRSKQKFPFVGRLWLDGGSLVACTIHSSSESSLKQTIPWFSQTHGITQSGVKGTLDSLNRTMVNIEPMRESVICSITSMVDILRYQ